jgi:hypothetical protein
VQREKEERRERQEEKEVRGGQAYESDVHASPVQLAAPGGALYRAPMATERQRELRRRRKRRRERLKQRRREEAKERRRQRAKS